MFKMFEDKKSGAEKNSDSTQKKEKTAKENTIKSGSLLARFDSKVESALLFSPAQKLRIIAKALLYITAVLLIAGLVLIALLLTALGGFGTFVSVCGLALFALVGYGISTVVYAYAEIVEKKDAPQVAYINTPSLAVEDARETCEKQAINTKEENEFPEF